MATSVPIDFNNYQALSVGAVKIEVLVIDGINPPAFDPTLTLGAMDFGAEGIKITQTTDNVRKVDSMTLPVAVQFPSGAIELTFPIIKTSPRCEAWMQRARDTSYLGTIYLTTEKSNNLGQTPLSSVIEIFIATIDKNYDTTIGDGSTVSWSFKVTGVVPVNQLTF